MDDFGILGRDFGYKPLGNNSPANTPSMSHNNSAVFSDHDPGGSDAFLFDDVFGGPPKFTSGGGGGASEPPAFEISHAKFSSVPVFDKPLYDDDMFDGLPELKTPAASSANYDDVFSSLTPPRGKDQSSAQFDDFIGDLGGKMPEPKTAQVENDTPAFDDLLPGFGGGSSPAMTRPSFESSRSQKLSSSSTKLTPNVMEDPFVVLESTSTPVSSSGLFTDPLDEISKSNNSGNTRVDCSFSGTEFDDVDPFDSLGKPAPQASSKSNHRAKDGSPMSPSPVGKEETSQFHVNSFENHSQKKIPVDSFQEPHQFDMSNTSTDFRRSVDQATSPPSYASFTANEMNSHIGTSPRHEENLGTSSDIWLTVSEVPLFTKPTSAPPPSRPPPPRPARVSKSTTRPFDSTNSRDKGSEFSSFPNSTQYSYSPKSARAETTSPLPSQIDELENFVMGSTHNYVEEHANVLLGEKVKANSDGTAIKEAMDVAEANFMHAKEVREREHQKTARSRDSKYLEKDEKTMQDSQEKELRERQERLDRERQQREREEEEREQRRLEKEREQRRLEKAREMEREREKARQAVERATREARERAAAEARLRAERAAVEKAQAEARERAERAAVQRAQAEARERAAAEAKERAEKAAAETRERGVRASASRAEADARFRAERASAERAAAARVNQQKNDDDLESFFSMGSSRPSSDTMPRANFSDPLFDTENQSKGGPEVARTSVGASSNIRKASSSTNVVDDLTSIFGAAPSSGGFQDIERETEERRRARIERHQRTKERAAKALAEKNQRDLQAQREQAERHRIAVTLDFEIKRWAAGKEGNLRALLSTLHYVLWPECGWQPVSLTDMITAASVKKVYRKATLCIHPDKVQQKGANLQQKYIAEKVFDLLKEAWNKFNSEELF